MKKLLVSLIVITIFASIIDAQRRRKRKPRKRNPTMAQLAKQRMIVDTFEKLINNYEIDESGKSVRTFEVLYRVDTPYIKDAPLRRDFVFNSDLESVEVLASHKIAADGTVIPVPKENITVSRTPQAAAAPAFSSLKVVTIDFGKISHGEKYYYKVKTTEHKTYFEGKFSTLLVFTSYYNYTNVEVNVKAPASFPISVEAVGLFGGKNGEADGKATYQWKATNLKPVRLDAGQTDYFSTSARLSLSSFKNYEELANFYRAETEKKNIVTPEIKALADKITEGAETTADQASAIYLWVNKNIRYLSIILDRGGWIPHNAVSILQNGYGDCKDYSTLIQTLLKAKNIESSQVLIRADQNYWFPDVTLPEVFDHVILYIPSLDLYADATAANTRLGLISPYLREKNSLHASKVPKVVKISQAKPEDNQIISDVALEFNGLGDIRSIASNTYIGESEMGFRPVFADTDFFASKADFFVGAFLKYYGIEGIGKILNVSDSHKVGKPFNVEIEVERKNYTTFTRRGSVKLPAMLNLYNYWDLETATLPEKQISPIAIGTSIVKEKFSVRFPDQVRITRIPKNKFIDSPFGSFSVKYALSENVVEVERELVVKKGVIQPGDYLQFKKFVQSFGPHYYGEFSYRTNSRFARKKWREKSRILRSKPVDYDSVKKLTRRQVLTLERRVLRSPADSTSRKRLIRHYKYEIEPKPITDKKLFNHQIWFIKNQPREEISEVFGYYIYFSKDKKSDYERFKAAWLKAILDNPNDPLIRFNASRFFAISDKDLSMKLVKEAEEKFPDRYEFPILAFGFLKADADETAEMDGKREKLEKAFLKGDHAFNLIKKERSVSRDVERSGFIPMLADVAFQLEKYEKVSSLARELILEFADDETESEYVEAAHRGNILLGKVALVNGETEKAKDYLMTAINASTRLRSAYLAYPDLELVESLLLLGEKEVVLEYLKTCEKLKQTDKLILKRWQAEIKQGKSPTFDWFDEGQ